MVYKKFVFKNISQSRKTYSVSICLITSTSLGFHDFFPGFLMLFMDFLLISQSKVEFFTSSGPIMTFSKNEIRDKDDNECLLDELLEESFDKNYGDDDANETNFDVLPRIFEGLCKSTSISMENREAAWDILLWFAVSSHDDILGGGMFMYE